MNEANGLAKLAASLVNHNVPSFSPQTGMSLLTIEKKVRCVAGEETDKETKKLLNAYADALKAICNVGVLHQSVVIGTLDKLVTEARTPKMWPSNLGK